MNHKDQRSAMAARTGRVLLIAATLLLAPRMAIGQRLDQRPHPVVEANLVRGESATVVAEAVVLFSQGDTYVTFSSAEMDGVLKGRQIDAPQGLQVEVLALQSEGVQVSAYRTRREERYGDGYRIVCRAKMTADKDLVPGPYVAKIELSASVAMSYGSHVTFEFRAHVWESAAAMAAAKQGRKQAETAVVMRAAVVIGTGVVVCLLVSFIVLRRLALRPVPRETEEGLPPGDAVPIDAMTCTECHGTVPPGRLTCPHCGAPVDMAAGNDV